MRLAAGSSFQQKHASANSLEKTLGGFAIAGEINILADNQRRFAVLSGELIQKRFGTQSRIILVVDQNDFRDGTVALETDGHVDQTFGTFGIDQNNHAENAGAVSTFSGRNVKRKRVVVGM